MRDLVKIDEALYQKILSGKSLSIKNEPFRYAVVDNFFPEAFYKILSSEFSQKLDQGLSENYSQTQFYRQGHYDAYAWILDPQFSESWNFFYSRAWFQFLRNVFDLFGLTLTPDTRAAFHHHKPFGKSGQIHTDYCLTNFVDEPLANNINPWFHQCIYMRKRVTHPSVRHLGRAIALLFYLNNSDPWVSTEGGETGLYDSKKLTLLEPFKKIEPKNNRVLIYEISPISYHAFLPNRTLPRNALAQWFHAPEAELVNKYKEALK